MSAVKGLNAVACTPADDWNWTVEWDGGRRGAVVKIARTFGFEIDPEMFD